MRGSTVAFSKLSSRFRGEQRETESDATQTPAAEATDRSPPAGVGDARKDDADITAGETNAAESALVEQARSNPTAFGALYERYVDKIYAYIYRRVGNTQDAEDLTARTFYRALDRLETYEDRGLPFGAWLFRIAHNLVANWHRDHSRRRFLPLDKLWGHGSTTQTPDVMVELEERREALWSAINRLPNERRDLLLYKFSNRLSNLEIGALMDKSESAVKSLYFRTLASLRNDLEARGWGMTASEEEEQEKQEGQEE
jgi:RNA polymerase sigma-70 factor (ECF subfamily)